MTDYIKYMNDIAFRTDYTDPYNTVFIHGYEPMALGWSYQKRYGYGFFVKKIQFTPGSRKKETVDVKYLQGTWNYYEPFEEYAEVTAWRNPYKAVIQCKIPYSENLEIEFNKFVEELDGKSLYWHICHPVKYGVQSLGDDNKNWLLGTVKIDKLSSGDCWTFAVTIEGELTVYTSENDEEEETDE